MGKHRSDHKDHHNKDNAILVTGGSGFIGRRLVANLAEKNETVVCMYHHRLPDPMANVYPVCSDMGSPELIAAPLRGVESVVHLAWENNFVGPTEKVNWNIHSNQLPKNIRILKNLIAAMEKAKTKRIVFLSAIGASRKATSPFLQEKYFAEFFVLNSKIPEKVIIRSSLACSNGGPNDRFLHSIMRVMQFPAVYPVPNSRDQLALIHIDDLSNILLHACTTELEDYNSSILEVRGKEMMKVEEIFRMVSMKLGSKPKIAIKGFLGNSLLPLFEREKDKTPHRAKLLHFLTVGSAIDENTVKENPLAKIGDLKNFRSIRESLTTASVPPRTA